MAAVVFSFHVVRAGGLKDLPFARPGEGYTGHSFNDFNHCDLTAMAGEEAHNENKGQVAGIQYSNKLGRGIELASLPELGPGMLSWHFHLFFFTTKTFYFFYN